MIGNAGAFYCTSRILFSRGIILSMAKIEEKININNKEISVKIIRN